MRTITTNVYLFSELSEEAQQKAIDKLFDINTNDDWWEAIYEDANNIGLEITSFDIGRTDYCNGNFSLLPCEIAQNILKDHGEDCGTYIIAEEFLEEWQPVFNEYMNETSEKYESSESENDLIYIESEFLKSLLEEYKVMLLNDYVYLTSEQGIINTIEANDYEFTGNGELI